MIYNLYKFSFSITIRTITIDLLFQLGTKIAQDNVWNKIENVFTELKFRIKISKRDIGPELLNIKYSSPKIFQF